MFDSYQAYGEAARVLSTPTLIAGRHRFHGDVEPLILADVEAKLRPEREHRLLEIGCGVGVLLTPLAGRVAAAVGVDHPSCVGRYRALGVPANVTLHAGRWPDAKPAGTFDRILVYSVLQCVADADAATRFIDAALEALAPDGLLLLGDIPNADAGRRFHASGAARRVDAEYRERQSASSDDESQRQAEVFSHVATRPGFLDDRFVLALLERMRAQGREADVLPQPRDLPFSYTREDVLAWRRA